MQLNSIPVNGNNQLVDSSGAVYRLIVQGGSQYYILTYIAGEFDYAPTTPLQPSQTHDLTIVANDNGQATVDGELLVLSDGERSYAIVVDGVTIVNIVELD